MMEATPPACSRRPGNRCQSSSVTKGMNGCSNLRAANTLITVASIIDGISITLFPAKVRLQTNCMLPNIWTVCKSPRSDV